MSRPGVRVLAVGLVLGGFVVSGAPATAADEIRAQGGAAGTPAAGTQGETVTTVTGPTEEVMIPPATERVQASGEHLGRMREVLTSVLKHLEEAQDSRDIIKLNCVNEKLTAVKGLLKVSEQADVAMQEALARRDDEASVHEFRKIAIARGKVEQILAESEACVGEHAVYAGDTEVDVIEPPEASEPPPASSGGGTVVVRPPVASPY